jgi:hypothetical protein
MLFPKMFRDLVLPSIASPYMLDTFNNWAVVDKRISMLRLSMSVTVCFASICPSAASPITGIPAIGSGTENSCRIKITNGMRIIGVGFKRNSVFLLDQPNIVIVEALLKAVCDILG